MTSRTDHTRGIEAVAVDHVLATTRAVRRRLDLSRPVPDDVLLDCIDLAEQAPTGGNLSSRRWMVLRDPEVKARFAELYRRAGGDMIVDVARVDGDATTPEARVMRSAADLAEHLAEVPALVVVCIWGEHDGSGRPGLFDSVIQAAWSFALALRARGLGTAWTTIHLGAADEVAELLHIPDGVTQIVLLPVAYTVGTDFRPADRRPASEITYWDRWGHTRQKPSPDGGHRLADLPGVVVERTIAATPKVLWPVVTDISLPAWGDTELVAAEWLTPAPHGVGSRFAGHNHLDGFGDWDVICHVTRWEPRRVFEWAVNDVDAPGATWRFELDRLGLDPETRVRFSMAIGPGPSGTSMAIEAQPDDEARIIGWRRRAVAANMARTLERIAAEAATTTP